MAMICGIDEAGRGPAIGPLVVCGVLIDEEKETLLQQIGARDSKTLAPGRREKLFAQIGGIAKDVHLRILSPKEIDAAVFAKDSSLNQLETAAMAAIIKALKPDKAYIDCPSNNIGGWTAELREMLDFVPKEIIAENKADALYPVVSAASIMAKVTRDRAIEALKRAYNVDFGSGYPADPKTKAFLAKHYRDTERFPFFRKSWESYQRLVQAEGQKSLRQF